VLQQWRAHDAASQALTSAWHWPDESLLQSLRDDVPALTLR
jgi:hypothetical protein